MEMSLKRGMTGKEVTHRLDEIIKQQKKEHRIQGLEKEINDTCLNIYKQLTKVVGTTQVAKRTGKYIALALASTPTMKAVAAVSGSAESAETIRKAFEQLMDIATAIAEPILWFYALTSLILMATGKSKTIGWNRLKNVGYAYIGMVLLPTIFAFLHWVANMLKVAFKFVV